GDPDRRNRKADRCFVDISVRSVPSGGRNDDTPVYPEGESASGGESSTLFGVFSERYRKLSRIQFTESSGAYLQRRDRNDTGKVQAEIQIVAQKRKYMISI